MLKLFKKIQDWILEIILKVCSESTQLFLASKACLIIAINLYIIIVISATFPARTNPGSLNYEVSNSAFSLKVTNNHPEVYVVLEERQIPMRLSQGNYIYRAQVSASKDTLFALQDPAVTVSGRNLTIRGKMAGLDIKHSFYI